MSHREIVMAFDALVHDGSSLYRVSKDIDGYPEEEGTHLIMGARAMTFLHLHERQTFYEPLSNYDHLLEAVLINARLVDGHVPRWARYRPLVSFRMFESIYGAPEGRVPLPKAGEAEKGVHAVGIDGGFADSGEALRFINSWGTGWGDRGLGLLSREYLERYMIDAWLRRNARVGPSVFIYRKLMEATNDKEFGRTWMMQNPRWQTRLRHHGRPHRLQLYETLSILGNPVEVIEVRNGWGQRLGWAYLHHISGQQPRTSILKELFVWPWFRRRGYGTLLEALACERAKAWRSTSIQVLFHDADARPRNRAAGRLFGMKAGYEWKWRRQQRPNLAAVGKKCF